MANTLRYTDKIVRSQYYASAGTLLSLSGVPGGSSRAGGRTNPPNEITRASPSTPPRRRPVR